MHSNKSNKQTLMIQYRLQCFKPTQHSPRIRGYDRNAIVSQVSIKINTHGDGNTISALIYSLILIFPLYTTMNVPGMPLQHQHLESWMDCIQYIMINHSSLTAASQNSVESTHWGVWRKSDCCSNFCKLQYQKNNNEIMNSNIHCITQSLNHCCRNVILNSLVIKVA